MSDSKIKILAQFMPAEAAPIISEWINQYKCAFKISKSRLTKFGDYCPPQRGQGHKISVNHNLNQFAFLVTTVHEFAHLITWNQYQNAVKPHGIEWKANFKLMMQPFLIQQIFPANLQTHLIQYLQNPAASSCSDMNLFKALQQHDQATENSITIEQLAVNGLFEFKEGRVFKKIEKLRKRYKCVEVKTGLIYLFSPLAPIKPL